MATKRDTPGRKGPTFGMLEEDEDAVSQQSCVDCGALSPPTRTAHTLIGKAHGWRVTREETAEGAKLHWRCPTCWVAHRQRSLIR